MSKTVVGLYPTMAKAEEVKQVIIAEGFSAKVIANSNGADLATGETNTSEDESIGQKISNFFHGLTGGDADVHHHYAEGINAGGALVGVTCDDDDATDVAALLKQHGATAVENKGAVDADTNRGTYNDADTSGQTSIPIVEEQLAVGKREIDRGGVRVYSHVTEKPATADVTLRDEQVFVDRRPVNRAATAADFDMGQGSVIEMNATGEEAVVGKTARVVEEVRVGKTSTSHNEVIHDSVRKTEVEVEQVPASIAGADRY